MGILDGIPPEVGRVRDAYTLNRNRPIYAPSPIYEPDPGEPVSQSPVYQPYHAEPLGPLPEKPLPPPPTREPEPQPPLLVYEPMPDALFRALMRAAPEPHLELDPIEAPPPAGILDDIRPVQALESIIDPDPFRDDLRYLQR